jgi:hypothetical protein
MRHEMLDVLAAQLGHLGRHRVGFEEGVEAAGRLGVALAGARRLVGARSDRSHDGSRSTR